MREQKSTITVDGKHKVVNYLILCDGAVYFSFAREELATHRAHRDGYAYDNGGILYRAAVDRAVELGIL